MRDDRVLLSGEEGVVEYVADETTNDPMSRWLFEENRGGRDDLSIEEPWKSFYES
jgi:hypothetical protein